MKPTRALRLLSDLSTPHLSGHTCTDGQWYNRNAGARMDCPTLGHLRTAAEDVTTLHAQVHDAAHDTTAATAVAEGMTGLVMADLQPEDREGWVTAARMAIEALAAHLDRDPEQEARAAAALARLVPCPTCGAAARKDCTHPLAPPPPADPGDTAYDADLDALNEAGWEESRG